MLQRNPMTSCVIALLLLALSGCGQTGPLYLPEKPVPEQPTQQQPAPEEPDPAKAP
jgi:predicted small lipoprotein YifL